MSRQIEMTWKCSSCDHRNLGRFKVCQNCKNPKDGSEEWEMPDDPSSAPTVTEDALLRMALAGPDWRCAYCGSDQRRTDKGCANCGADALEGEETPDAPEPKAPPRVQPPLPPITYASHSLMRFVGKLALVGAVLFGLCYGVSAWRQWNQNRPRDFSARVSNVSWRREISVERYQLLAAEGFKETMPADALDVRSLGKREHHQEQVFDHNTTETYFVDVPDGYRTESYSDRESCGQTCTSKPQTCREVCKSNKNGFATCSQQCSGGGQSCSTKYCTVTKTRQIAKTRRESRTRQVPVYRSEPRYAEAFAWNHWEWRPNRTVNASGSDVTCRWPTSNLKQSLGRGEDEREQRSETFSVTVDFGEGQSLTFAPSNEDEFAKYPPGSSHTLHTQDGRTLLDGAPVSGRP